jgi:hypothetical protein
MPGSVPRHQALPAHPSARLRRRVRLASAKSPGQNGRDENGIVPTVDDVLESGLGDEGQALVLVDLLGAVLSFPAGRAVNGVSLLEPSVPTEPAAGKLFFHPRPVRPQII